MTTERTPRGRISLRAPLTDDIAPPLESGRRTPARHDKQLRRHKDEGGGIRICVYKQNAVRGLSRPSTTIGLGDHYRKLIALCDNSHATLTAVARECSLVARKTDPADSWTSTVINQMYDYLERNRLVSNDDEADEDEPPAEESEAAARNNAYWEQISAAPVWPERREPEPTADKQEGTLSRILRAFK